MYGSLSYINVHVRSALVESPLMTTLAQCALMHSDLTLLLLLKNNSTVLSFTALTVFSNLFCLFFKHPSCINIILQPKT